MHDTEACLESVRGCPKQRHDLEHHNRFISFRMFSKESFKLPSNYEHMKQEIFELIKVIANLTVKINVNYVSNKRPTETNQGPYLFGNLRGLRVQRTGTGFVYKIEKNNTQYLIHLATARHVVFDIEEACNTQVFFFDKYDNAKETFVLKSCDTEVKHHVDDTEDDVCRYSYLTTDQVLAEKLLSTYVEKNKLRNIVGKRLVCNDKDNSKVHFPAFLLSHPHGKKLYISVGECLDEAKPYYLDCNPHSESNKLSKRVTGCNSAGNIYLATSCSSQRLHHKKKQPKKLKTSYKSFRNIHKLTDHKQADKSNYNSPEMANNSKIVSNLIYHSSASCSGSSGGPLVNIFGNMCTSENNVKRSNGYLHLHCGGHIYIHSGIVDEKGVATYITPI